MFTQVVVLPPSCRPPWPFKARCVNAAVRPELRTAQSTGTTPNQKWSSLSQSMESMDMVEICWKYGGQLMVIGCNWHWINSTKLQFLVQPVPIPSNGLAKGSSMTMTGVDFFFAKSSAERNKRNKAKHCISDCRRPPTVARRPPMLQRTSGWFVLLFAGSLEVIWSHCIVDSNTSHGEPSIK